MGFLNHFNLACCCTLALNAAVAQTGPAGVGNASTNVLWLKADAGTSTTTPGAAVSAWNDQSGNSINVAQNTVAQQPLFQPGIMNGFPAIQFDNVSTAGQNDKLLGPDSPLLDNTNGYSFFTVSRPQALNTNAIVSKRINVSVEHSFMLFYYTSNRLHVDIESTNDRFQSNTAFANNTNYLLDVIYDGTLPAASRTKVYVGETLDREAYETSSAVPDNASPLLIGTTDASDPRAFGGYISEVIMYRTALNKASRIIVNNYLSSKYDIPLTANDKYIGDLPANGNYDFEVAGIGVDTIRPSGTVGSSLAFASSVTGGFGMTAVSGLDVGDYVMAGHAVATNSAIQTDVAGMTGPNNCRWLRTWFVDVTNTAGPVPTINVEFDLSDGGMTPSLASAVVSNYVLLYRPAQTGSWTEVMTASSLVGDKIRFNGYAIANDGYYTIGSKNCFISPLPVELLSFTAVNAEREVELHWSTASELNNDFFTVERSLDGYAFTPLFTVPGAGSSTALRNYSGTDEAPANGLNYYRLKQTDTDGAFTHSDIISVLRDASVPSFTVFPNPNRGDFSVSYSGKPDSEIHVQLFDTFGKPVFAQTMTGEMLASNGIQLEGMLAAGYYLVQFTVDDTQQTVRIVVE